MITGPGRPKKRRRKATYEKEDQAKKKKVAATSDGKRKKKKVAATVSKCGLNKKCTKCGIIGHNKRKCTGEPSTPMPSSSSSVPFGCFTFLYTKGIFIPNEPPRVRSFAVRIAPAQGTTTTQGTATAQGTTPPNTRPKAKPRKRTKPSPPWK
ncbi:uncharacterized protein G2W53_041912 [Senna tora]|uniref:CCHC-type domain-containing protein n=1 Tax=Senna tora TaxID=362788 RepID=A0A834SFZ6_9FABA|nr:uncharacterized protein G2W53_041912 [Senna tora]